MTYTVDVRRTSVAVLVEVSAAAGAALPPAWLARWRTAVTGAALHVDDQVHDDGSTYVAARVRARRAGPLLDLAAELRHTGSA